LAAQTRDVTVFGFFNKRKEEKQNLPPLPRRDDALARTADLVQATGDSHHDTQFKSYASLMDLKLSFVRYLP
jgi:hypothetical protein